MRSETRERDPWLALIYLVGGIGVATLFILRMDQRGAGDAIFAFIYVAGCAVQAHQSWRQS